VCTITVGEIINNYSLEVVPTTLAQRTAKQQKKLSQNRNIFIT